MVPCSAGHRWGPGTVLRLTKGRETFFQNKGEVLIIGERKVRGRSSSNLFGNTCIGTAAFFVFKEIGVKEAVVTSTLGKEGKREATASLSKKESVDNIRSDGATQHRQ